jgi:uncharacterized protein (DUF1501 family)
MSDFAKVRRRTLLQAVGAGALAASLPILFRRTSAQSASYDGPYWVFVNAIGGWDPMFLFNPTSDGALNRVTTATPRAGNIAYAPIGVDFAMLELDPAAGYEQYLVTAEQFLATHGRSLVVVNGIDTSTNNHDAGQRTMASGQLALGYPSLAALVAGVKAATLPLAYVSGGGYDLTDGLVPLTRFGDARALANVLRPNEMDPGNADTGHFHTAETMDRIVQLQRQRGAGVRDAQHLPTPKRSMQDLLDARVSNAELQRLVLPGALVEVPGGELRALQGLMQQAQLALAAFKSGLAVSATLSIGGFDTHGNHDRDQSRLVLQLLGGVDYLIQEAGRQGLGGSVVVVVTSDFGRGPGYNGENDNAGKDHWPVTSMFALGPGIAGDRVVGATDGDQRARPVDAASLAPADGGVVLRPEHVHRALRKVAGVATDPMTERYPLPGEDLALFG